MALWGRPEIVTDTQSAREYSTRRLRAELTRGSAPDPGSFASGGPTPRAAPSHPTAQTPRGGPRPAGALLKEREQLSNQRVVGTRAVFANLERLRVTHGLALFGSYHFTSVSRTAAFGSPARVSRSHFLRAAGSFGTLSSSSPTHGSHSYI